jgi:FixJ family two-component response regulator
MPSEPKQTILAIDDEDALRRVVARTLRAVGYHVEEAADGEQGLAMFEQCQPDAVLLDLRMPGLDGLELLSLLAQKAPDIPVVVLSGESCLDDAVEALKRGAWDFVSKPFRAAQLRQTLERTLEQASLRREVQQHREQLEATNRALEQALLEREAEQQRARVLQFHLLPEDGLELGQHVASRRLFPSRGLSGDFVDYFPLGDHCSGFYLADVAGHGAPSALVTAILATLVHRLREAVTAYQDETA